MTTFSDQFLYPGFQWAKPGPYHTELPAKQETQFRQWVKENKVPFDVKDTSARNDYDMRGFYQALQSGDPVAQTAINASDQQIHYPDKWKTPFHQTFSNESQYATEDAPRWQGDDRMGWKLVDKYGYVIHSEVPANK